MCQGFLRSNYLKAMPNRRAFDDSCHLATVHSVETVGGLLLVDEAQEPLLVDEAQGPLLVDEDNKVAR
jgi:hypothetical protein